ncbi:MAG: hypothetical protein JJU05_09810 [Verrucomicrobia bacterium]|nr:hypothetical protein [Verrucomicrobiota bacterium]
MTLALPAASIRAERDPALPTPFKQDSNMTAVLEILPESENPVPRNLFGQFLERPSWGDETGPEAFYDPEGPGFLRPDVFDKIAAMDIPLLRFPGGTDIDFMDWTDMIDNAPGRENPARPESRGHLGQMISNQFGYHEYFALRDRLACETLLVVNLRDALIGNMSPDEAAAHHAAGLLAYANAPLGAELPAGMPDWPAIRARNGHPEPFGAEYVQIGNEWIMGHTRNPAAEAAGSDDAEKILEWYLNILHSYVRAIREIDPKIKIILDNQMDDRVRDGVLRDPYLQEEVWAVTLHSYAPWAVSRLFRGSEEVSPDTLSPAEWWNTFVAMPGEYRDGVAQAVYGHGDWRFVEDMPYRIVVTEWNWNGWTSLPGGQRPPIDLSHPAGIGAAGFLNGLMRHGDRVKLATQSMLVGTSWNITAVRAGPEQAAFYRPQGLVSRLYSNHHGPLRLKTRLTGSSPIPREFRPHPQEDEPDEVDALDIVVTAHGTAPGMLWIHAVNRSYDQSADLAVRLPPALHGSLRVESRSIVFPATGDWVPGMDEIELKIRETEAADGQVDLELPPRSVTVFTVLKD